MAHEVDILETNIKKKRHTEQASVSMKVDDTFVEFKTDVDNPQRAFTKPLGNPSVKPTQEQMDVARSKGLEVIEDL